MIFSTITAQQSHSVFDSGRRDDHHGEEEHLNQSSSRMSGTLGTHRPSSQGRRRAASLVATGTDHPRGSSPENLSIRSEEDRLSPNTHRPSRGASGPGDTVDPVISGDLDFGDDEEAEEEIEVQEFKLSEEPSKDPKDTRFDQMPIRWRVYFCLDGFSVDVPKAWDWASLFATNFTALVISLSVVTFLVGTLPHYEKSTTSDEPLRIIEASCIAYFCLEFLVRWLCAPIQRAFWTSGLTWIDVLTILPYFVLLAVENVTSSAGILSAFRVLRLARVVRVMKFFKNNVGFLAVWEAIQTSSEALSLMFMMLLIALVTFSSFIYFGELEGSSFDQRRGQWIRSDGTVNPFQSVFHAMWWCVATVTTVGYGDETPTTPYGKAVGGVTAICGVFVISFPTAILGANFAEIHNRMVYEKRLKDKARQRKVKSLAREQGRSNSESQRVLNPLAAANNPEVMSPESPSAANDETPTLAVTAPSFARGQLNARNDKKAIDSGTQGELGNGGKEKTRQHLSTHSHSASSFPSKDREPHETKRVYRVDDKGTERDMWVTQDVADDGTLFATRVSFGPALTLKHAQGRPDVLTVRTEELFPEGHGKHYHLTLVLADLGVLEQVTSALDEMRIGLPPDEENDIAPRKIEKLTVDLVKTDELDGFVTLSTREFYKPRGSVNLTIVVESKECDRHFLKHIPLLEFVFTVKYEADSTYSLPQGRFNTAKVTTLTGGGGLAKKGSFMLGGSTSGQYSPLGSPRLTGTSPKGSFASDPLALGSPQRSPSQTPTKERLAVGDWGSIPTMEVRGNETPPRSSDMLPEEGDSVSAQDRKKKKRCKKEKRTKVEE